MDFVWYAKRVYKETLFPYVQQLREQHPYRKVVIIEDNCLVHPKARKYYRPLIHELDIHFAGHPAFLPNLNKIETLHREQGTFLRDYTFKIDNARKETRNKADKKLKSIGSLRPSMRLYPNTTVMRLTERLFERSMNTIEIITSQIER